jgi:hypothetical protein
MIWSDVTVITAAIPNRIATYLPLCIASVRRQTRPPIEHRIGIDHLHRGHGPIITGTARRHKPTVGHPFTT